MFMSCRQHGYPWPSSRHFSLSLIASGRSSGPHPYPHTAAECMFESVVLLLPGHMWGSIGVSILLYGCATWTLTKRLEKKLYGNYTRMLRAILNKSWRQHPTRHQLYGHLPPITKTIQVRRTRHVGHDWSCRNELISDVLLNYSTIGKKGQTEHIHRVKSTALGEGKSLNSNSYRSSNSTP